MRWRGGEAAEPEPEPGADRRGSGGCWLGVPVLEFFSAAKPKETYVTAEMGAVGGEDPDPRAFCLVLST